MVIPARFLDNIIENPNCVIELQVCTHGSIIIPTNASTLPILLYFYLHRIILFFKFKCKSQSYWSDDCIMKGTSGSRCMCDCDVTISLRITKDRDDTRPGFENRWARARACRQPRAKYSRADVAHTTYTQRLYTACHDLRGSAPIKVACPPSQIY